MYVKCYRVSADTYWLDKIVDHFDRMIANLSDPDGNGYLGWNTTTYTDALGWPTAGKDNKGDATIEPELVRARNNKQVTGHTYIIEFNAQDKFSVTDTTADALVAGDAAYKSGQQIAVIPGIKVAIAGKPALGDTFEVRTEAVIAREGVCHDGVITYPIALFIEAVKKSEALYERYGEKTDQYADLLQNHFLKKWEHVWVEPAEIPNTVRPIPHNQYLALGRTYLVMAAVADEPEAAHYRDVAEKMGRYFKSKLRLTGQAYTFAYWDPVEELSESADDVSHGGLSLSFCIEAANRDIVFSKQDMDRFAHTLLDQVWNGSLEDPQFSRRVNGEGAQSSAGILWPELCRYNDDLWKLLWAIFREKPGAGGFLSLWHARPEVAQDPPAVRTAP